MNKKMIGVSILCNVYNHEKYLRECLESLVNQKTNFKYEILVHDDCSTDNSKKIIEEYYKKYPDKIIPFYEKENQYSKGVKINKTILIPKMKGKYFCFCEGDDYWIDENKLQKQYDFLENNLDYSFCIHNSIGVNKNSEKICEITPKKSGGDLTCEDFIINGGGFVSTNAIFSRSELAKNPPKYFDYMTLDYIWQIYLSSCGKTYCFKEFMSAYRIESDGSWTNRIQKDPDKFIVYEERIIKTLELFNKETKYKYDKVVKERIALLNFNIFELKRDYKKMYEDPYNEIRKKQPIKMRIKYFISVHFPFLFKILYRIFKNKELK